MAMLYQAEISILEALLNEGVRSVVIGGAAVQHHGHTRSRDDLDILVEPTPENASRVVAAIGAKFRFTDEHLKGLAKPGVQMHLGGACPVEVLTSVQGVDTKAAIDTAVMVWCGPVHVPVLALDMLLATKRARGSDTDLADIEALTNQF
ncbi:MAG: hypothetical protein AAGL24_05070 [Pseudomonadota bacterium]